MAENPFDRTSLGLLAALGAEPRRNGLLECIAAPTPQPEISPMARAIADLLKNERTAALPVDPTPYVSGLGNLFGSGLGDVFGSNLMASPPPLFALSSPTGSFGSLAGLVTQPALSPFNAPHTPPPKPKPAAPETKRRAFFSFHFDDIMRVNNVRNAWKITHPDSSSNRSFRDSSLWGNNKLENPESVKQLIRAGVLNTSAVCVLAGSMTWERRWVRYEIARAIVDGRGLLTVHVNGINHHQTKGPHPRGRNPLAHMGIAKLQPNKRLPAQYYLYEMTPVPDGYGGEIGQWDRYPDYTLSVKKPDWLTDPAVDHVVPLSTAAAEYDYEQDNGNRNIGSWIDRAAKQAGR